MERIESPRTDDSAIEQEIKAKGLTAPRVTPADIEANIASEHYFTAADGVLGATIDRGDAVNRFLTWPVPASVYPDGRPGDPGRTGTNLLSAHEARAMLDHVLGAVEAAPPLGLLTFCVLTLANGFTVTGESACASPENFDAEIGRKIARQNAVNKIWALMGYELRSKLALIPGGIDAARRPGMTVHVGSKAIRAKPMTRQGYNDLRGWTLPADKNGADTGMLVEYLDGGASNVPGFDGYVSWSPADVFNRAYPAI